MYTQCPACLTTFKVTPAQLEVHGGMVRCGICSAIFHAEQRLLQVKPKPEQAEAIPPQEPETAKNNRGRRSGRRRIDKLRSLDEKLVQETGIPTVTKQPLFAKPRLRVSSLLWGFGSLTLLMLLAGQFVYFYRNELATIPSWRPYLVDICLYAGCKLRPLRDIARIELLQTSIAPHPQYENALRIRATLVNRAAFRQAYPWMEVSLTSNAGNVIARRTFAPIQYSESPLEGVLTPNVVATALLDVTNPDGKAVGYEIRLVSP
ncbi:MAG: zinc-ribbon domain-containing protein [Gammaproteobacteria bacterium]|nr:zinc-ribbon domain-containing protein [Gammaproteobacteria bacterium]